VTIDENLSVIARQAFDAAQVSLRMGHVDIAEFRFRNAASLGSRDAMIWLGDAAHHQGALADAWTWYEAAASEGSDVAMVRLGLAREASGDEAGKVSWFLRAVQAGSRDAMFNLGNHFRDRDDFATAKSWYAKAAALGDDDAMRIVGALEIATGTLESAVPWFERAAAVGNADADVTLRRLKMATRGDADSIVFVAWAFTEKRNDAEAARWTTEAIRRGVADIDQRFGEHFEMVGLREEAMERYSRSTLGGNRQSLDGIMRLCDTGQFLEWIIGALERGDDVANDFMTEFRLSNGVD